MRRSWAVTTVVVIALAIGAALAAWAQDEDEGPMSNMQFLVVRDYNGKPVRNAAVVLHPVTKKGNQAKGGLELKTDNDGRAGIEGIPYGPLRVQVLAPGYQTFGDDYVVSQPETAITVRLKRPAGLYSAYGNTVNDKKQDKPADKSGDKSSDNKTTNESKPQ